jgi:hypothetical protein
VVIEVSGGTVRVRVGSVPSPDLVLTGRPQLIAALFTGQLTAAEVAAYGLEISGDTSLLDRILPGKGTAYPNQPPPDPGGEKPREPARSTPS